MQENARIAIDGVAAIGDHHHTMKRKKKRHRIAIDITGMDRVQIAIHSELQKQTPGTTKSNWVLNIVWNHLKKLGYL